MQGALFAPASRVVARVYFDFRKNSPAPFSRDPLKCGGCALGLKHLVVNSNTSFAQERFSLSVGEGGRHLVQVQLLEPLRPRVEHREQAVVDERRVRPWDARRALRDERALKLGV